MNEVLNTIEEKLDKLELFVVKLSDENKELKKVIIELKKVIEAMYEHHTRRGKQNKQGQPS